MRLLLIRHAESAGNAARVIQGTADLPLTALGEQQAALLAARLKRGPVPDALYSSPLRRAMQTAEAIGLACSLPVQSLDGVREYDFGLGNGMSVAEARQNYSVPDEGSEAHLVFPGEEGRDAFRERVSASLWALADLHPDETVAVVAHGGPVAAFLMAALGLADRRRTPFRIQNASLSVLDIRNASASLHAVNDRCHLEHPEQNASHK
jgi:broad specificity phosphatase PhoE